MATEAEHTGLLLDGRYRVQARLGQGGMGTVYLAEHVGLGQRRAIKFLREELARKPGSVKRFLQEARVLSSLHHDNLVSVIDMGEYAGSAYYVMELLGGEDLRTWLRRDGALAWSDARTVALHICEALRVTHARGIVHRDLKPENCFCTRTDRGDLRIKLIDFGVAKVPREVGGGSQLTGTGEALGTVGYMAPEQLEGQGDSRVDIYSLGTMLFEMLAGRPAYTGNAFEIIARMLRGEHPNLLDLCPHAEAAIEHLITTAIARDPGERFATMDAFAAAITAVPASAQPQRASVRASPSLSIDAMATTMHGLKPAVQPTAATMHGLDSPVQATTPRIILDPRQPSVALPYVAPTRETELPHRRRRAPILGAAALGVVCVLAWTSWPRPPAPPPTFELSPAPAPTVLGSPVVPVPIVPLSSAPQPPLPELSPAPTPDLKPTNPKLTTKKSAQPLSRSAVKQRLTRELQICRSKFAAVSVSILVTPSSAGRLVKLSITDDGAVAPRTASCIEQHLTRARAAIKDIEDKKPYEIHLDLEKAP